MASRKSRKKNNLLFLYFFVFTGSLLLKGQNISFSFGMMPHDEVSIRFTWGVKSLPWLIMTDKQQIVIAEGFGIADLTKKIKENENTKL
jgi:hypothetical protein